MDIGDVWEFEVDVVDVVVDIDEVDCSDQVES